MRHSRKEFLQTSMMTLAGLGLGSSTLNSLVFPGKLDFRISLAEWSLNKELFSGEMTNLDFPVVAARDYGIQAVEYVNQFFMDKAEDMAYLGELKFIADDQGVENVLIMIDGEGDLAATGEVDRTQTIENHYKWVTAAKFLGCHSIRVNLFGEADQDVDTWTQAAVDGLGRLSEFGEEHQINIIVENHGRYSSNGSHLANVLKKVNNPYAGTLPDFGNFCTKRENGELWGAPCVEEYDKYQGVRDLMPYAKGVSAKCFDFDKEGNETTIDFRKMLNIIKEYEDFDGYIGVEYEGEHLPAPEGIRAGKALLEKLREELSYD